MRVRPIILLLLIVTLAGPVVAAPPVAPPAEAGWQEAPQDNLQKRAAAQLKKFKEKNPGTLPFFEQAHSYVIFPRVTRIGFGIGGAGGKGVVVEQGEIVGTSRFGQFTSGIQAGFRIFRMIIFFKEEEDLEYFKQGKYEFAGQAGVSLANLGAAADGAYNSGVAVFTKTKGGLMVEATISVFKMSFKPVAGEEATPSQMDARTPTASSRQVK